MTPSLRPLTAALLLMSAAPAWTTPGMSLPFTLEAGLPLVAARIDGREARLLIDSGGAAALALRQDWAAALGTAGAMATQDAQGGQGRNATLAVGELVLAGQALPAAPPAQTWAKAKRPAGADGYLGWGWLRERRWVVDYAARQLRLLAPEEAMPAGCGAAPGRFELLGSLPVVRLQTTDGQLLTLGLDTGASRNVVQPALAAAAAGGLRWDGRPLAVGGFVTVPLQVPGLDGFLGQDFFSRHRVCLDPGGRQLWVQPLAD
jgi:hypothetical protein